MKNILVHVDGGARSSDRLRLAVGLAQARGARLVGLFGQLASPHRVGVIASWPSDAYLQMAEASREAFAAAAAALPESHWRDANRGSSLAIGEVVGDAARCFDLVILGQGEDGAAPDIAAAVLARSGRPALVIPAVGDFPALGRSPMLVWDESPAAARALHEALPLLSASMSPLLAVLTEGSVDLERTEQIDAQLRSHGITARIEHVAMGESSAADVILNRAADLGADLLVSGWSDKYGPALLHHLTVPALLSW